MNIAAHVLLVALPVFLYVAWRDRRLPSAKLMGIAFLASQFPDFVDKPLAHLFFLIPSGRVFLHSLPFALPIVLAVAFLAWKTNRTRSGMTFAFGYLSHIAMDSIWAVTSSQPRLPSDLFWPFLSPVQRPVVPMWVGPDLVVLKLWTVYSVLMLAATLYLMADAFTGACRQASTN